MISEGHRAGLESFQGSLHGDLAFAMAPAPYTLSRLRTSRLPEFTPPGRTSLSRCDPGIALAPRCLQRCRAHRGGNGDEIPVCAELLQIHQKSSNTWVEGTLHYRKICKNQVPGYRGILVFHKILEVDVRARSKLGPPRLLRVIALFPKYF